VLLEEKALNGCKIEYEPDVLPNGRKIDFVIDRGKDNLYVEVKTVRPKIVDSDDAWQKYLRLKKFHP
jgi:DNA-binding sugar fermentation-stimulating protein